MSKAKEGGEEVPIEIKNLDLKIRFEQMDLRLKAMETENKVLRDRFNGGQGKLNNERREALDKIEEYLKQIEQLRAEKNELENKNTGLMEEQVKKDAEHEIKFKQAMKEKDTLLAANKNKIQNLENDNLKYSGIEDKWEKF